MTEAKSSSSEKSGYARFVELAIAGASAGASIGTMAGLPGSIVGSIVGSTLAPVSVWLVERFHKSHEATHRTNAAN